MAVGWNDPGAYMLEADFVVCFTLPTGPRIIDSYSLSYSQPLPDLNQSAVIHSASTSLGITSYLISRPLITTDNTDYQIRDKPLQLLYSMGADQNYNYHTHRDSVTVNLLRNQLYRYQISGWDGAATGSYSYYDQFEIEWGFSGKGDNECSYLFFIFIHFYTSTFFTFDFSIFIFAFTFLLFS